MSKVYRPYEPDQLLLLPSSLHDWLPKDHMVYFLEDVLNTIDLSPITSVYEVSEKGYPPYHPKMLISVIFHWLRERCLLITETRPGLSGERSLPSDRSQ
jgi:transposase